MKVDPWIGEGLPAFLKQAATFVPVNGLGVLEHDGAEGAVLSYASPHGVSAHRVPLADLPEELRLPWTTVRRLSDGELARNPTGMLESRLLWTGMPDEVRRSFAVRQVVANPLAATDPPSLLIMGIGTPDPLTAEQKEGIEAIADAVANAAIQPEPLDVELGRLRRLDAADRLLPALFQVLEVGDIFDTVSSVTQELLSHDLLTLGVFNDEASQVSIYAHTSPDGMPQVLSNPYPRVLSRGWMHHIFDDISDHPIERHLDPAKAGARSSLNMAIRSGDKLLGGLTFFSRTPGRYKASDIAVARRIANYVGLALSHNKIAEQARRAEALRERAANLEMLDGLLGALTDVLDVREVFDRLSDIAKDVLPHDALGLPMVSEDGEHIVPYASRGIPAGLAPLVPMPAFLRHLFEEPWEYELYRDILLESNPRTDPYRNWNYRSFIRVPVRLNGRVAGVLVFFSRAPNVYSTEHVLPARRMADHVALALSHQRLADEARKNEELAARTANLEMLDELMGVVTGAGELPDIWDRISSVAQKVIRHDALVLTALLPGGLKARVYASKTPQAGGFAEIVDVPPYMLAHPDWEFELVEDLQARPEQKNLEAVKRGYRSALRVAIRLDGEYVAGVSFLAFEPGLYKAEHVPIGRRIADRLSLSFARERGKALAVRADEATARATRLEARVRALTDELDARTGYRRVVGESKEWRQVLTQATQVAATETTVLLLGESGTGKEVVARFLHRASSRSHGPFVALNCAALPEHLLEAELFGYERGAFTGAVQSKPGQIEQAAGGSLFLDEVGEMSPSSQAKFLRVLQEREFQRLGGTRVMRADVRVVAATNRNLERAIEQGTFREDLYYRLAVFPIYLPALRERADDVLPLSEAFLAEYGRSLGTPPSGISREARDRLKQYHWPGNVRELRNILERAAILCEGGLITPEHLALNIKFPARPAASASPPLRAERAESASAGADPTPPPAAGEEPAPSGDLQEVERKMVEQALKQARFNKSKAAKALGISRAQLYLRMRRYGLE